MLRFVAASREAVIDHPLIKNLETHDQLSAEEKDVLVHAIGHEKEVPKGEEIIREGDRPWASTILLNGFAARAKFQVDGTRQINAIHVPGDFVDLHSFVLKRMDHSVVTLTSCTFAMVPHDALHHISTNHPHLTRVLWTSTAVDGAILREWVTQLAVQDAYRRTAHLICELFVRLRSVGHINGHSFALPILQNELSDMLGLSHVHMNRTLMKLRKDKLFSWQSGVVTIHDWDHLKEVARFDPLYLNLDSEGR